MRLLERNPRLSGLMVGLAVLALAGVRAQAQLEVSSTQPGSIAVFPKVIADGTRDTIISMTNTSNMMVYVHCQATNGIGVCRNSPDPDNQVYYCNDDRDCLDAVDPSGAPVTTGDPAGNVGPCDIEWISNNFDIALTAQQPTFWRMSTGRVQDGNLNSGESCTTVGDQTTCPGFFLGSGGGGSGGNILPVGPFRGEMRCFQTEADFSTLRTANALKGEAFIEELDTAATSAPFGTGTISGYNSINVEGGETPSSNPFAAELNGVNYASCPDSLTFDTLAPGQADPATGESVDLELTFIPCSFNTADPIAFRTQMFTYDELESEISGGDVRTCWANYIGSDPVTTGNTAARATPFLRTTAAATHTGNCTAGGAPTAPCTGDQDCGRGGTCINNSCQGGTSVGRVCVDGSDCGAGGVCGPPTKILGVVETIYGDAGGSGTDINVMHQLRQQDDAGTDVMVLPF